MLATILPLRAGTSAVYLEAYLLKNSAEFQTDVTRPAVLICPGGAYMSTSDREAEPVALRFLARGYHAFVVRYSVRARFPAPMIDLANAMLIVRAHADAWFVDPDQIAVCGFSAGGHLAASLGVLWDQPFIYEAVGARAEQIRPHALILGYPVIDLDLVADSMITLEPAGEPMPIKHAVNTLVFGTAQPEQARMDQYAADRHVSPTTPPAFIWHTAADELVLAENALRFALALGKQHVPYELHIFESGVHGLSLADEITDVDGRFMNAPAQTWLDLALTWLKRQRAA